MRTKEEIEQKIDELYSLSIEGKMDLAKVILATDVLAWVLGKDYLETNENGIIEW